MSIFFKRFLVSPFLLLAFTAINFSSKAAVFSGFYPVGNSAPLYSKISQIADSLANATITSDVVFELQSDYDGTVGEILPITFRQFISSGGNWTVTIRPAAGVTGRLTSGDPGSSIPLIQMNGISNLIIDGRPGGLGNSEWTIRNTRTATAVGPVFTFINDATFNTLKYLSVEGQNPSTGLILFSTSTGTLGNSNNNLTNNSIHDRTDVIGLPGIGIYSAGSNTARNKNNIISNNNLYNWTNFGINITPTGNGEGWQILSNNFYNTQATNSNAQTSIQFLAGASSFSNMISSNFIGGQMAGAAGSKWINSAAGAFNGIITNVSTTAPSTISNNSVQNISLTNTGTASFTGISCSAGSIIISGNIIGSASTPSSITTSGSSTVTGINSTTAGNSTILNNTIDNIISSGASSGAQVRGIVSGGTGSNTVTGNTIANLSSASSSTSTTSAALSGIYINSSASSQVFSQNVISGLVGTNATANTYVLGITISNTGNGSILSNKIFDNSNSSSGIAAGIAGICIISGSWDVMNNMVSLSNSFTNDISLKGIWDNAAAGTNNFYYNSIYISGSGNTTNSTFALLRSGASTVSIKNNFLYNNRTGSLNYALANTSTTPAIGWATNASNHNFFVTAQNSSVNIWGTASQTFNSWKSISQCDAFSYNETTGIIPPAVFINPSIGNLKIVASFAASPSNLESRGVAIAGVNTDLEGDSRPGPAASINGGGTIPDIGADEFDGVPNTKDIGVTAIVSPSVFSCPGSSESIQFSVTNFGSPLDLSTNNITINSHVTGPNPLIFSSVILNSGTLGTNSSITVTVSSNYNMSAPGSYTFYANSILSGDVYTNNDSLPETSITLTQIVALPATVNFSGYTGANLTGIFPDWTEEAGTIPAGGTSLWTSQTNMGIAGNTTARINLFSTGKKEWIVGPKFNATATTKLRFSAAVTAKNSTTASAVMGADDVVQVMLSTDCGQSWFPAVTMNSSNNLPAELTSQVVLLGGYSGQRVLVAFYATDGTIDNVEDYDFHLDNINISNNIDGYDLGVTSMPLPVTTGCYSANDTIKVTLKNFGPETINFSATNATVTANVTGPLNQTFNKVLSSGSLSPWSSMSVIVTTNLDLSTPGTYSINAFSSIVPDYDSTNNAMNPEIRTNAIPMNLPDYTDFTGFSGADLNTVFPNWTEAAGTTPTGSTSTWLSQTGLNSAGNVSARINLYTTTRNEWLISKKFRPSSTTQLKFYAAVTNWNSTTVGDVMGSDDAVSVMISTNCGVSWFPVFTLNKNNNLTTTLQPFTVNLNTYSGSDIMVAFKATDGPIDNTEDYGFHLDNIEIRDFFPIDIGAKTLITPFANSCSGTNDVITVGIKNFGTDTLNFSLTPVTLNVNITGASTQSFSTVISSGILLPDSIFSAIATTSANFSAIGTHMINATTTISGDGNNGNNSYANPIPFITTTISNFPYSEGFETAVSGWSIQQITGNGLWTYFNGAATNPTLSPNSGTKMAYFNSNSNGFFNAVSRLSTTCLNFSNLSSPKLEFYMSQDKSFQYNKDSLFVVISTDGGTTWGTPMLSLSRYNATYSTPGWKKISLCLDQYAGMSDVKIGFVAKSEFGSNIYIDDVTISESTQPFAGFISSTSNLLCGGMNTFFNLYSYSGNIQWQQSNDNISYSNITNANFDTLSTQGLWDTTYFRVVTSFNNVCIVTDSSSSIQIDVLPSPRIDLGADSVICANSFILNAGIQASGTTFQWNDGNTNQSITATTSGQYYVTGTSTFFCQHTDTINLVFKTPVIVNAGIDQTICEGNTVTLTAISGATNLLWNTGSTASTINVTPDSTTSYTVIATGINGCKATDTVEVNVNSSSFVDLGQDIIQCGGNVILNAGSSANTYLWNTGATTSTLNVTNSGVYYAEATSAAGCTSSDTINVTINPAINLNLGSDISQCGGTVNLNAGNTGATYLWNTGATSQNINITSSGTYFITVSNGSGCTKSDTILVNINLQLLVNLGADIVACAPNVTLVTTANGNYLWNTGAITSNILVNNSGTYFVSVNSNGCIASDTINVSLSSPPIVNLGADITSCSSPVLLNAGNNGSNYLWNTGATNQSTNVSTSGNYIVTVSNGGCSASDTIKVTIYPSVVINAGADITVCSGSNVQLSASGGSTYLWNNSLPGQTISITPTASSTYTVVATDTNGCSASDQVNVSVTYGPSASFTYTTNIGTITTTNNSTNSSSFVWDFGDGSALDISTSPSHTYLTGGTYTIILIAVNGCGTDTSSQVFINPVGIDEKEFENSISIYPVPTSGILNVDFKTLTDENISIKIITPEGRSVGEKTIKRSASDKATFDLSGLPSGLYFVQITNDKIFINKKIILQK